MRVTICLARVGPLEVTSPSPPRRHAGRPAHRPVQHGVGVQSARERTGHLVVGAIALAEILALAYFGGTPAARSAAPSVSSVCHSSARRRPPRGRTALPGPSSELGRSSDSVLSHRPLPVGPVTARALTRTRGSNDQFRPLTWVTCCRLSRARRGRKSLIFREAWGESGNEPDQSCGRGNR